MAGLTIGVEWFLGTHGWAIDRDPVMFRNEATGISFSCLTEVIKFIAIREGFSESAVRSKLLQSGLHYDAYGWLKHGERFDHWTEAWAAVEYDSYMAISGRLPGSCVGSGSNSIKLRPVESDGGDNGGDEPAAAESGVPKETFPQFLICYRVGEIVDRFGDFGPKGEMVDGCRAAANLIRRLAAGCGHGSVPDDCRIYQRMSVDEPFKQL